MNKGLKRLDYFLFFYPPFLLEKKRKRVREREREKASEMNTEDVRADFHGKKINK